MTRSELEAQLVERIGRCDVAELMLLAWSLDELEAERAAAAGEHDDFDFAEWDALDDQHEHAPALETHQLAADDGRGEA